MFPFAATLLTALVLAPPVPAPGADPPETVPAADTAATIAPRLDVALSDGRDTIREGGTVTYVLTVSNPTGTDLPDVVVSQLLPHGVRLRGAQGPYDVAANAITWHLSLPAGARQGLTVTGDVTADAVPGDRAGATVCVAPGPARPLAGCASDEDTVEPARAAAAWAATATAALTGIVVAGSAILLRLRMTMTLANGGKARRWRYR